MIGFVDRHYNHAESSYPLAHNLVASHYVSGAVRFPVAARLYRRSNIPIPIVVDEHPGIRHERVRTDELAQGHVPSTSSGQAP